MSKTKYRFYFYFKTCLRKLGLLQHIKRVLTPILRAPNKSRLACVIDYFIRTANEQVNFSDRTDIHDLPPIYHYWSNKFLRPKLETYGYTDLDMFFVLNLEKCFSYDDTRVKRFVSLGAGNFDNEVRFAKLLLERGYSNFTIECLELNQDMLDRGKKFAEASGMDNLVIPLQGDFNTWIPDKRYDAVIANQSLHHVLELEHLFDAIKSSLGSNGYFITSDMIGRNYHLHWPEAMAIIQEFWHELPDNYRYNQHLKRHEKALIIDENIEGWDFEGIRAQDILPLAVERFHFEFFAGFANIIDQFIGRDFGYHFDVNKEWDRDFIGRVHERDKQEMLSGHITPTHMLAVMRNEPPKEFHYMDGMSPEQCIRHPD